LTSSENEGKRGWWKKRLEKQNQGVDKQIEINRNQNCTEHRDEQHRRRRMTKQDKRAFSILHKFAIEEIGTNWVCAI